MKAILRALCFVACLHLGAVASADADYYQAFTDADAAAKAKRFEVATRAIEDALRRYPGDYGLTLKLAYLEFQAKHYEQAEQYYRRALELSDGANDARVGLGWALIQQKRCPDAVKVLEEALAEDPDQAYARAGMVKCHKRPSRKPKDAHRSRR